MNEFNMPPGVSTSDIPGNEERDVYTCIDCDQPLNTAEEIDADRCNNCLAVEAERCIPTDNPTPPGIPAVFVEAAKEAGESLEGWQFYSRNVIVFHANREVVVTVQSTLSGDDGMVHIADRDDFETSPKAQCKFVNLGGDTLPDAIRLANRLVRALTGETEGEK